MFAFQLLGLCKMETILSFLQQPKDSIDVSQAYVLACAPGAYLQLQFESIRRFLVSQGSFSPIMYSMMVSLSVHV